MVRLRWCFVASLLTLVACGHTPQHPDPVGGNEPAAVPELSPSPSDSADACVGVEAPTERLPVDLFAVLDGSSSMAEATAAGVSKWYATKSAFSDFLEVAPAGMGLGLSLFPLSSGTSCAPERYHEEALPISSASEMVGGVLAR
ncbi:MAG TPA: hypothetical protein VEX18_06870, partial [Polyangiaceae bacterium]|nr:hypothetical protein [Polyangiaceae bacterium]